MSGETSSPRPAGEPQAAASPAARIWEPATDARDLQGSGGGHWRGAPWPLATTRLAGVIGDPIGHSLSPLLHNAAFAALGLDWVSVAFQVGRGGGAAALSALSALGLAGVSVTMPLKEEVAAAADELAPTAARLGAANCVVMDAGGRSVGHSTDGDGFVAACLHQEGFDPAGRRCVVTGAGGAARAVIDALARGGAAEVAVIARTPARAEAAAALGGPAGRVGTVADVATAELVVQATPVGMGVAASDSPIDGAQFGPGQLVVDLVYHPRVTRVLEEAAARGARTANGLGMLVHQAALAVELWTGHRPPVALMEAALSMTPDELER